MPNDPDAVPALREAVLAALRSGCEHTWGNKETNGRILYEGGVFVEHTYDSLMFDHTVPMETRTFADPERVLSALAPRPESEEGWRSVLKALRPAEPPARWGDHRAVWDLPVDDLVFGGVLPDGAAWSARAEGRDERHVGMARWPFVRVRVEVRDPTGTAPGPFAWCVPCPDQGEWRAEGLGALRKAVEARLVARLAVARMLDFSAPEPLPGGGTWSARHADRYENDGFGFDLVVVTAAGPVDLHHALARPGTADPHRERTAARTRLTKWIRRQLQGA